VLYHRVFAPYAKLQFRRGLHVSGRTARNANVPRCGKLELQAVVPHTDILIINVGNYRMKIASLQTNRTLGGRMLGGRRHSGGFTLIASCKNSPESVSRLNRLETCGSMHSNAEAMDAMVAVGATAISTILANLPGTGSVC
jgi:hypothetical protein